jgi:transcriptional antiterminator RfaH
MSKKTWYLIQCKPKEAFRAEEHLNNQHLECFLPTHSVKRQRGGRARWIMEPLFPHYLFIHLDNESNWGVIRSTRGVSKIVDFNGKPASVADSIVYALRHHCALLNDAEPQPIYKSGESVIITEGCFRELEAIVKTAKGEDRVILLLNILNRQQEIELPASAVSTKNQ